MATKRISKVSQVLLDAIAATAGFVITHGIFVIKKRLPRKTKTA